MNRLRRTLLSLCLAATALAASGPAAAGDDPFTKPHCDPYLGRKGPVCPPVGGIGVVADPGFAVSDGGAVATQPDMAHFYLCLPGSIPDYSSGRDMFLGEYRGGCMIGTCLPDCHPDLDLLKNNIRFCPVDHPANVDGLRICGPPVHDPVNGTWSIRFRIVWYAVQSRPGRDFANPHLLFKVAGPVRGLQVLLDEYGTAIPRSPIIESHDIPYGKYLVQLTFEDDSCTGTIEAKIGETENYDLQVWPTGVELRAYQGSALIPPISCQGIPGGSF